MQTLLPDRPQLISGALGGPFVIYACTPLRNALTLGSQDRFSGARLLLRKVFRGGPAAGWTGGGAPAVVACPQFLALGPIYHTLNKGLRQAMGVQDSGHRLLPAGIASMGAALCETCLTFGSQSRNAQMAYNNSFVAYSSVAEGERTMVPLNKPTQMWGVGAAPMLLRNALSAGSVRVMSPWLQERLALPSFGLAGKAVFCDVCCSVSVCTLTAPAHQLFNFMATTPHARSLPSKERWLLARDFVYKQYFQQLPRKSPFDAPTYSWRVTGIAARDYGMRTAYVTSVFTIYMSIERSFCAMMR
mmetsp:Transcript_109592/g.349601  ORF Transcript_109592/g.349601 Transcript_109592/m.349601 type:complete len:302 (+) Transcript_109592:85-990(+)